MLGRHLLSFLNALSVDSADSPLENSYIFWNHSFKRHVPLNSIVGSVPFVTLALTSCTILVGAESFAL